MQWFLWVSRDGSSGGRLPVVLGSTSEDAHGSPISSVGLDEDELDGLFLHWSMMISSLPVGSFSHI